MMADELGWKLSHGRGSHAEVAYGVVAAFLEAACWRAYATPNLVCLFRSSSVWTDHLSRPPNGSCGRSVRDGYLDWPGARRYAQGNGDTGIKAKWEHRERDVRGPSG